MEDRFKFRFYDKNRQKMETYEHNLSSLGVILASRNPDKIPMQCTGLKDKNGKLIYEGDILKNYKNYSSIMLEDKKLGSPRYWTLEYKIYSNESGFIAFGINRRWYKKLTKNMIYNCGCEIIGNIYENPELLEDK